MKSGQARGTGVADPADAFRPQGAVPGGSNGEGCWQ